MTAERASFGFSLFCDDIRHEMGGKYSLMGLYQRDMFFPSSTVFPTIVPKFVIFVKYYEQVGAFSDDLVLKISLPGDDQDNTSVTQVIPRQEMTDENKPVIDNDDDSGLLYSLSLPIILSPFTIKCAGYVSVRIYCGSEKVRLGRLMLRIVGEDEKIIAPGF